MSSLHFLHVTALLGGSERAFLDFMRGCPSALRGRFHVVVPEKGPLTEALRREMPEISITVHPFPILFRGGTRKRPLRTLFAAIGALPALTAFIRRARGIFGSTGAPHLYVNGLKWHFLSIAYKRFFGARLVWHVQDYFPNLFYTRWYLRLLGTAPDLVICNSDSVRTAFVATMPAAWSSLRVVTVHNAVDIGRFTTVKNVVAKDPMVSMIGMFTPWKGQDVFVEAVALLLAREPLLSARFQLVGDEVYRTRGETGYRDRLVARIHELGLEKRIRLRGLVQDVESVYATSDIVVHCSREPEPFGKVIVEAMAAGCAVIAADAGGVSEIVSDGKDGFLSPPGDAESLAEMLSLLCRDEGLRGRVAAAGQVTARARFSSEDYVGKILAELRHGGFL